MTKQFTAKYPCGKKSHGEMFLRLSVFAIKFPYGELSVRQNVRTTKCPYGELSVAESVRTVNCPTAKSPVTKHTIARFPWLKMY